MSTPTIKSRPQYQRLQAVPTADKNLVAAEGEGIQAVIRMMSKAPSGFARRTHVLHAEAGFPLPHELDRLREFGTGAIDELGDTDEALRVLDRSLEAAAMGTQLYAAGSESFLGRVVQLAVRHGIEHDTVVTELLGSHARRVQCVHCKQTSEHVTLSVFECPGCGTLLFVRDHYSRRLAAFQGVCANAEDPSEHPPSEELYR